MLTKAQYHQERQIESQARRFVQQIFRNTKKAFQSGGEVYDSLIGGYAIKRGKDIDLVGYTELSKFIHSLKPKELKKFMFIFINQVHQGAYHICKRDLKYFEKFSNMKHVIKVKNLQKKQSLKSKQLINLRFLHFMPSFYGKNGKVYGPFKRGDRVKVERSAALLLIRKGRAKEIGETKHGTL